MEGRVSALETSPLPSARAARWDCAGLCRTSLSSPDRVSTAASLATVGRGELCTAVPMALQPVVRLTVTRC